MPRGGLFFVLITQNWCHTEYCLVFSWVIKHFDISADNYTIATVVNAFPMLWLIILMLWPIILLPTVHISSLVCYNLEKYLNKKPIIWSEPPESPPLAYVPSEDSNQPAHSRSLIRIFTGRILDRQWRKVSLCGQRRLIRLRGCGGWFESSMCVRVSRHVFSRCGYCFPSWH